MDIRTCGVIVLGIVVICGTMLLIKWLDGRTVRSVAWAAAFEQRGADQNVAERKEWIAANCELAAQVEQLKGAVADLTCENDRMRDLLRFVKVADVKILKDQEGKK
jgi:hypothetical protein